MVFFVQLNRYKISDFPPHLPKIFATKLPNVVQINYLCKNYTPMNLIEQNLQHIQAICNRHKVQTLSVFGSVLTDAFHDDSDVDLLVQFGDLNAENIDYVSNYFELRDALESLFNRKVDLIEEKGLRNKYFIANINRTKQQIYG
jgi:predicted nucleotidyltransferase